MHLIFTECAATQGQDVIPLLEHLGYQRPVEGPYQRWLEATKPFASGPDAHGASEASQIIARSLRTVHAEFLAACDKPTLIDARDRVGVAEQLLAADQAAQLVVLYRRPERSLPVQLAAGAPPSEALARWNETATSLLLMIRRQRRRSLVVDIDQALSAPNLFLQACRERLNVQCKPWVAELTQARPEHAVEPFHQVIAAQLLAQSTSTQGLLGELEAAALALDDPAATTLDCDAAWNSLAEAEQQTKLVAQHKAEAEQHLKAEQRLRDEVDALNRRLEEASARPPATVQPASGELKRELDDAKEENELLLAQLHQVQEELERCFLQSQSRPPVFYGSDAQAKLERMKKTLSWRITAPLRWGFRPFKRKLSKQR